MGQLQATCSQLAARDAALLHRVSGAAVFGATGLLWVAYQVAYQAVRHPPRQALTWMRGVLEARTEYQRWSTRS